MENFSKQVTVKTDERYIVAIAHGGTQKLLLVIVGLFSRRWNLCDLQFRRSMTTVNKILECITFG